jgi:hypothetical protein
MHTQSLKRRKRKLADLPGSHPPKFWDGYRVYEYYVFDSNSSMKDMPQFVDRRSCALMSVYDLVPDLTPICNKKWFRS